eukprot:TRINITY_DN8416_c0_g1_i1.p1 TRINITY_DN8416_c0_g1~~TRINITY_DN8416_c0_g1_i1.p1  ORF type:complete len:660 (+),score=75.30 TRINITY_DN8416_c0_g1_i1:478-2457(+)
MLAVLTEINSKVIKHLTNWVIYSDPERKYSRSVTGNLINCRLLQISAVDSDMAKKIDKGRNNAAIEFALFVLEHSILAGYITPNEFPYTLEALKQLATTRKAVGGASSDVISEMLVKASSMARQAQRATRYPPTGNDSQQPQSPSKAGNGSAGGSAPSGVQSRRLFEEWIRLLYQPNQTEKVITSFVLQLHHNVLMNNEVATKSFIKTSLAVALALTQLSEQDKPVENKPIDALAKLITLLMKYNQDVLARLRFLSLALDTAVRVLLHDYTEKGTQFNQRPYFRLFSDLLSDLSNVADTEQLGLQFLAIFSNAFMILSPNNTPGFCFAWLQLISHRSFMPMLLLSKGQKGWALFQRLLVELFRFLSPFLQNVELNDTIRMLYKGTLRVLLVLLHDFPEFLCDYHFSFCDAIPYTCIQLRNLILSAFPRKMRLPDPFTPNLKVDLLPEINQSPHIRSNFTTALAHIKPQLDTFLTTAEPSAFPMSLRGKLRLPTADKTVAKYNIPLLNALVLYVGQYAVIQLQAGNGQHPSAPIAQSTPMDIFQTLAFDMDCEGRYYFLNAIANQLRYPNSHTHYFSCVLLYLFAEANSETDQHIQEQITRVLFERLITNRPHPWGLLITFIELIKNPRYKFWKHDFTKCAPEIERMFRSVAKSCMATVM